MRNVLLVTNTPGFASQTFEKGPFKNFNLVTTIDNNGDLLPTLRRTPDIHIVLITAGVEENSSMLTQDVILEVRKEFPNIRVVYIAGELNEDDAPRWTVLASLVKEGVYDIIVGKDVSIRILLNTLETPKTFEDVKFILDYASNNLDDENFQGYRNVIVCASVKPGSGKTLLAVNVATAIAKYGQKKKNGNYPRVAIVEGDFSDLSLGTVTKMSNPTYNVKAALTQISRIINEEGIITGSDEDIERVKGFVRKCFVRNDRIPNLYALVSSEFSLDDLSLITPQRFYFMIQCIVSAFDVIIVDSNSALEHRTTAPLYELAGRCYFLIDPDYNNIQNNIRYKSELDAIGVGKKCRYILNKDNQGGNQAVELLYEPEVVLTNLKIARKIPLMDRDIVEEKVYKGETVVEDITPELALAKQSFLNIANEIWKIDYDKVNSEIKQTEKPKKKGWF